MPIQKTTTRLNSRVTFDQFKFIKDLAKKLKVGQAEAVRIIIQAFVDNKK